MPMQLPASTPKIAFASASRKYALTPRWLHARKCVAKLSAAKIEKAVNTISIGRELKWPMLASYVEKPPSDSAEKPWQKASNQFIPANLKETFQTAVSPVYTAHSSLAALPRHNVTLLSFIPPP